MSRPTSTARLVRISAPATATASAPVGGLINTITVTAGGYGYTSAPVVTITGGGGSGATAIAHLNANAVLSITLNTRGSAYTSVPTVTIAPPPPDLVYPTLWSNDGTGNPGSQPFLAVPVGVTNGLFTVGVGDTTLSNMIVPIPAALFTQPNLLLGIWFSDGTNGFAELNPPQPLTAAPYAAYAANAGNANTANSATTAQTANSANAVSAVNIQGTIPPADLPAGIVTNGATGVSLTGTFAGNVTGAFNGGLLTGDGSGLTNVPVNFPAGLVASNFWQTTGNAGTSPGVNFLGTSDNEPLVFRADNQVALQLQYASSTLGLNSQSGINLKGGIAGNTISNGVVGGTIAGGGYHYVDGRLGSGNIPNVVTANYGTVGGGAGNTAGSFATVPGGSANSATGNYATVPGGAGNVASGLYSLAAGQEAQALHEGAFVWADSQSGSFASSTNDEFSIRANGGVRIQADLGIHLNANDRPLIVRDWDVFANNAPSYKAGIGRWGLFMEPTILTIGIPGDNVAGARFFQIAKYSTNGAPTQLVQVDQSGDLAATGGLNLDKTGAFGQNSGTIISNALTFGTGSGGSGEGIASKRVGSNPFDLEFYTGFNNRMTILSSGNVGIGTNHPGALLEVNGNAVIDNNLSTATLSITGGSDLAEPFRINTAQPVAEGEVVVIDEANPGQLKLTDQPYDTHVAGVVSGANGIHPGIQMHQEGMLDGGKNVALSGRVYVQADASNGPIKPGDLLTTSSTPGRAMKVSDHLRAQGAILGKAMSGLLGGNGMVLVLVTLQ